MKRRVKLRLVEKGEGGGSVSIFDDLDKLRAETAAIVATGDDGPTNANDMPSPRRARETETFARIPHGRAVDLYRRRIGEPAWAVLVELDRMILAGRGKNPVRFWSPRLRAAGLVTGTRTRALRRLEAAGVIELEWRKRGLCPLVCHLWYPRHD